MINDIVITLGICFVCSILIMVGLILDKQNILEKILHRSLPKEKIIASFVILNTSILALFGSLYIVYLFASSRIPDGTTIGGIDISKLTISDAQKRIEEYYPRFIKERNLVFDIEDKTYQIPLENISARLEEGKTIDKIKGENLSEKINYSLGALFYKKQRDVSPVFTCDKNKLVEKVLEIKHKVARETIDAHVTVNGDKIEKKAEIFGLDLILEAAVARTQRELASGNLGPIKLKSTVDGELILKRPKATMADIDGIDGIIGKASTDIDHAENITWIKNSVEAINNILIPAADFKSNKKVAVFSFLESLEEQGFKNTGYLPGVNQVASTLYAAFMKAGISPESFKISADLDADYYTPDIKRIKVTGSTDDFKYKNNIESPMIIQASFTKEVVSVSILGKRR